MQVKFDEAEWRGYLWLKLGGASKKRGWPVIVGSVHIESDAHHVGCLVLGVL